MHHRNTWSTSVVTTFCLSLVLATSLLSLSVQVASSQPVDDPDTDTRERVTVSIAGSREAMEPTTAWAGLDRKEPGGSSKIPFADEPAPPVETPHLSLTKLATHVSFNAAGVTLHYVLAATNDGNVTLTGVNITDAKLGALGCDQPADLAPTATLTCTGTYLTTQADVDAGKVDNTATAGGLFGEAPVTAAPAAVSVPAVQTPHLSLTKAATETSFDAAGVTLHYTLAATNDGNVTLTGVSIADAKPDVLSCDQPVDLAPAAALTCTGTYLTTQADVDAGKVDNTAAAGGLFGEAPVTAAPAAVSVPAVQTPHLSLTKVAAEASFSTAGATLHYTLAATNDGNVTLTGVNITDAKLGALSCVQPVDLAPAAALTCTGTYLTTQADVDAGKVDNTAAAGGLFGGAPVTAAPAAVSVPAVQTPLLSLTKSAAEASFNAAGVTLHYTLVATNGGNVTLTGVSISDAKLGALSCVQPVDLAPAAALTCTGTYLTTQADVDAGKVDNTAAAGGLFDGAPVTAAPAAVSVTAVQTPHLSLTKAATETNFDAAGATLHYTLAAINGGNVTLTGVSISDAKLGALSCAQPVDLAPAAALTCTGTYLTTQADVDAGKVDNTAAAGGLFGGAPVTAAPAAVSVPAVQTPLLSLTKAATEASFNAAGVPLHYVLAATNGGNVTLTGVSISDAKLDTLSCAQPVDLAPTETLLCVGTYLTTQADVDAGKVDNTAAAGGLSGDTPVTAAPAAVSVPAVQTPHLSLTKVAAEASFSTAGVTLHYTLAATNDGNVTLTGVSISDAKLGALSCDQPVDLAPAAALTCTGTYLTTQADVDAGKVDNTAAAGGLFGEAPVTAAPAAVSVPAVQTPHLSLTKVAAEASFSTAGATLHYTLAATNDGNVTLTGVSISDAKLGALSCAQPVDLAPTAALTCTGTYLTTQADVDAGKVDNTAAAGGLFGEAPVTAAPAAVSVPLVQTPLLSLTKAAAEASFSTAGATLHYTLVATNDGNVTLTGVSISDAKLAALSCVQPVDLAPTAALTCTGTYLTTQADVDAGKVDNTAAAGGLFGGAPVTAAPAAVSVPAVQTPHLSLTKAATDAGFNAAGVILHYVLAATNDGNVTLTGVSISDAKLDTLSCVQPVDLAPTETLLCVGTYLTTQADVDAGKVDNTAAAGGLFGGAPVTAAPATVSVPAVPMPYHIYLPLALR